MVVLLCLSDNIANAQDAAAAEHDEQARAYFKAGAFALAAGEFASAYEVESKPARLYNAGLAYEKANEKQLASEFYGRYLDAEPNGDKAKEARARKAAIALAIKAATAAENGKAAEAQLAAARKAEGQNEPFGQPMHSGPPGRLQLRSEYPGEIEIDGRRTGHQTPHILEGLSPGKHTVKVFAVGRVGAAEVTIAPGTTADVSVTFASVEAGGLGEIRIAATNASGAVGYLDGKSIGVLPQLLVKIPSGKHRVRVEHPDFATSSKDVLVQPIQLPSWS